jgi:lipopolysaccharide transport system ATP-binding protein
MRPIIHVENLGKQYRIGVRRAPYATLRDSIVELVRWPIRLLSQDRREEDLVWALRDVQFEVQPGEVVGVVGRNGAGKSTLLKILSRVTEPTTGQVDLYGRVGSLLEVGTGFHPELTGRENIYLNGAILGMSRAEINRKFDEIVAFAEVETFLDTPVKHYSSGMHVRLAFAVAAHLEPEILIVDEVLAVGDAAFQKKCLGKMNDVSRSGRTILFVSHNAHAVQALCSRALLLREGRLLAEGPPAAILAQYERDGRELSFDGDTAVHDRRYRRGSGEVRFTAIELVDERGERRHAFEPGETICFELTYECRQAIRGLSVLIALRSPFGEQMVTSTSYRLVSQSLPASHRGTIRIEFPTNPLRPGLYPLYFWIGRPDSDPFDVVDGLLEPLTIFTTRPAEELGYDPAQTIGYFSIPARLIDHR